MQRIAALLFAGAALAAGGDPVAEGVFSGLASGRAEAGAPALERDPVLDGVARRRAEEVARRPDGRRFASTVPIDTYVREAGLRRFLRASQYVATQSGYDDEAGAALRQWRGYGEAWKQAMEKGWARAGVATVRAADGTLVVVAVLLEPERPLPPIETIERAVLDGVNAERAKRGLSTLAPDARLAAVARAHSLDMARRGYMGHVSPEGLGPDDRAREAGIAFRQFAENVASNLHAEDPVATAVEGWMESRGHRKNILEAKYTRTGVGVAVADDGVVYFTQLFLLPFESGERPAGRAR